MPELWKDARAAPWQIQDDLRILEKGTRAAFARLIKSTNLDATHSFCFFIDGLDEYQETAQNDFKEMVRLLNGWTTTTPRCVKLCVSSREYNVFINAFLAEKRLRLHELTRFDMEVYARDKLGDVSDHAAKDKLVGAIIDKAQGIFLWAALVVKDMRNELENGADSAALMELVDSLPDELYRLFEHILKSLSKPDRRKAYQTLAIIPLSTDWQLPVSLFAYSFLDKYDADTTFAERDDFVQTVNAGMTAKERIELGRKRVNGWCKGLVDPATNKIDYAHRSIRDFLQNKATKDEVEASLAGFNPAEALCQLGLVEFRLQNSPFLNGVVGPIETTRLIGSLVGMRHAHGLDHAPFTFLCLLDAPQAESQWPWRVLDTVPLHGMIKIPVVHPWNSPGYDDIALAWNGIRKAPTYLLPSALYCCTFSFSNHGYPTWKIANHPTATDSATKVALLAYTSFMRRLYQNHQIQRSVLDTLLDRGILTSKTRTQFIPFYRGVTTFIAADTVIDTTAVPDWGVIELSFWQHYLIRQWLLQQEVPHPIMRSRRHEYYRDIIPNFGAILERLLRHGVVGAELRFTASISCLNPTRVEFVFEGDSAPERGAASENLVDRCSVSLRTGTIDLKTLKDRIATCPATEWERDLVYKCTLRSWIEGLEGMPNKEEVLRLLGWKQHSHANDLLSGVVESKVSEMEALSYAILLTLGKYRFFSDFATELANLGPLTALWLGAPLLAFLISVLSIGMAVKNVVSPGKARTV